MKNFTERMKEVVGLAGGITELSKKSGLSKGVLHKYINGESDPSRLRMIAMTDATGVSLEWLALGEGPMMRGANAAENKGSPDKATLNAAMAIYALMRGTGKMMAPDRFEELATEMWKLDHEGPGDLKNDKTKRTFTDIIESVLKQD